MPDSDWSLVNSKACFAGTDLSQPNVVPVPDGRTGAITLWSVGGNFNKPLAFTSTDGADWNPAPVPWPERVRSGAAWLPSQGLVLLGGDNPSNRCLTDVWVYDVAAWHQVPQASQWWAPRHGMCAVTFLDRMYVWAGDNCQNIDYRDVWSTDAPLAWKKETSDGGYTPRLDAVAGVFNNTVFMLGGRHDGSSVTDVLWWSPDAVHWAPVSPQPAWAPRAGANVVAARGQMYLIGGKDGATPRGDVWASSDGFKWHVVIDSAPWMPVAGIAAGVLNDRIYCWGGSKPDGSTNNAVWCYTPPAQP